MSKRSSLLVLLFGLAPALSVAGEQSEGLTRAVRVIAPEPKGLDDGTPEGPVPTPPEQPRLANRAGLTFEILPGAPASIGTRMSFRVGARRKGYVILVDVAADGKLTQIFPNVLSLAKTDGRSPETNEIPAGQQIRIPAEGSKTYEFVASPPRGVGLAMAIFSEAPLELVDLPDVPADLAGKAGEAEFVRDAANGLKILATDQTGGFQDPSFSFEARYYVIR
ncbi:DUF4384 domain-containing protein [Rhodoblastus sp. 17X3]|uniref:DUF4384 domain-containing protein n=1 Tax=Rhodoblastus sp. 17X3 TaxID=3047026 RepID=UPI0024B6D5D0|nr:DUF4384 domain-containing protein [Rhodoblastus sp. 17X3]MDI9849771.1 DUF4384 domain-containing protein [Rhodoblastus sp. 17X3]